jgi:hypothetical protein
MPELPYRQPSPAEDTLDEYYVKAPALAQQGAYTLASLRKAHNERALTDSTLVRVAGTTEWVTLRALIAKDAPQRKDAPKQAFRSKRRERLRLERLRAFAAFACAIPIGLALILGRSALTNPQSLILCLALIVLCIALLRGRK